MRGQRYYPSLPSFSISGGHHLVQRQCSCGKTASAGEQCEECKRKKQLGVQAKLALGRPNDVYEQEAERISDAVSQPTPPHSETRLAPRIQRLATGSAEVSNVPASVEHTLSASGRPLDPTARSKLEPRFGVSFADVRVHDDAASAESAREIGAHAYTHGRDIVFGLGQYRPQTTDGLHLLAHELTHVVQQTGTVQRDLAVEPQGTDKKERPMSEQEIKEAIRFNKSRIKSKKTLSDIRDVVGIAPEPAESDRDLALAVARWQFAHGVAQDGMLGPVTVMLLVEELQGESSLVPELATSAKNLKKEFSGKTFLDIDASFCGCEPALNDEIKTADLFIGHYKACGADPANKTGAQIESCVSARVGGVKVLASTSSTGKITANCQRTGPCAQLLCRIDLAHEQIHSVHTGELKQQHGSGAAFDAAFNDAPDWVADEIDSRNTDKSLAKWALKVLERTCP
jgi:hypothetical protein